MAKAGQQLGKSGKYGDLKNRLFFLLGALLVFRVGAHIPVPGIDPARLAELFQTQQGGILGLFNMFSGGALSRFTVFALGITPYISASIVPIVRVEDAAAMIARVEQNHRSGPLARKNVIVRMVPTMRLTIATGRRPRVSASRPASSTPMSPGTPFVMPRKAAMPEAENPRSSAR